MRQVGGSIYSSNWVNFRENRHDMAAGAWYVYKLFNGAVNVAMQNMQVRAKIELKKRKYHILNNRG